MYIWARREGIKQTATKKPSLYPPTSNTGLQHPGRQIEGEPIVAWGRGSQEIKTLPPIGIEESLQVTFSKDTSLCEKCT